MKLSSKKIIFHSDKTDLDIPRPYPASKGVPDWYRNIPGVIDKTETIKKCIPILDSLTAGYIIPLAADAVLDLESNRMTSNAVFKMVEGHNPIQTQGFDLSDEFDPQPHKWVNSWHIKTPKGYSTLFIHPLNQENLPFHSFAGIVDTDKHPLVTNFPFVMRKGFTGVIPAGTPIIQAIPFKRDEWDMQVIDEGKSYEYAYSYRNQNAPFNWYKRTSWHKKVFR